MESSKRECTTVIHQRSHRFTMEQKRAAVSLVEAGFSLKEVMSEYQISGITLLSWRKRLGRGAVTKKKTYSPSQKRSVMRAVEQGMSISEVAQTFDISTTSIRKWVIESQAENDDLAALTMKPSAKKPQSQQEKDLEQRLAEAELKIKALETLIDVAEENLKIDIRKKSGARQSPK